MKKRRKPVSTDTKLKAGMLDAFSGARQTGVARAMDVPVNQKLAILNELRRKD